MRFGSGASRLGEGVRAGSGSGHWSRDLLSGLPTALLVLVEGLQLAASHSIHAHRPGSQPQGQAGDKVWKSGPHGATWASVHATKTLPDTLLRKCYGCASGLLLGGTGRLRVSSNPEGPLAHNLDFLPLVAAPECASMIATDSGASGLAWAQGPSPKSSRAAAPPAMLSSCRAGLRQQITLC